MVLATLFFFGSVALIPLLPTGFIPPDDNSQTQVYLALPPGATLAQTTATAEQARRLRDAGRARASSVYTTIGGGSAGGDPFASIGARRDAQGHAHDPARRRAATGRASRCIENQIRAALGAAARRAQQGRPGRLGREVHPGADRRRPAGAADRGSARGRARPAHHPRPRQHHLDRQPDPPRDRRAARLRARRRPGRDQRGHRRDPAHRHRSATTTSRLPKLNLSQRQVPIVVKLEDSTRAGPRRCSSAWRCPARAAR